MIDKKSLLAGLTNLGAPTHFHLDEIGEFYVKKLSVREIAELDKGADGIDKALRLVIFALCDENGEQIFSLSDTKALGKMHADTLSKLAELINEVNNFDKQVSELKKD